VVELIYESKSLEEIFVVLQCMLTGGLQRGMGNRDEMLIYHQVLSAREQSHIRNSMDDNLDHREAILFSTPMISKKQWSQDNVR